MIMYYLKVGQEEESKGMPFWISRILANVEKMRAIYLVTITHHSPETASL